MHSWDSFKLLYATSSGLLRVATAFGVCHGSHGNRASVLWVIGYSRHEQPPFESISFWATPNSFPSDEKGLKWRLMPSSLSSRSPFTIFPSWAVWPCGREAHPIQEWVNRIQLPGTASLVSFVFHSSAQGIYSFVLILEIVTANYLCFKSLNKNVRRYFLQNLECVWELREPFALWAHRYVH